MQFFDRPIQRCGLILLAMMPATLFAQGNSAEARLRVLNGQAVSLLARYQRADASGKEQARSEAARLLAERQASLHELIRENPQEALRLALPGDLLDDLRGAFPESAANLENRGKWQGTLEYVIQDGTTPANTKDILRLHANGRVLDLIPTGTFGDGKCNDTVAASGVESGGTIVASETNVVQSSPATCSTTGAQKILAVIVNMPGYPISAPSETILRGIFLGNAASGESVSPDRHISDFWMQSSDGKTWVNNTGAGALTILTTTLDQNMAYCNCTTSGCSDNSGAVRQAVYAKVNPLVNFTEFSRVVMILPQNNTCNGIAGVASLGCWGSEAPGDGQSNISWTWWRADQSSNRSNGVMLGTHEMGHNLTMSHSGSRDHGADVIGPVGSAGSRVEYGDKFGTMGSWNFGLYNAHHAVARTGWMNTSNYIDVTASGVYTIASFDTQGGAVKALRVKRGSTATNAWFWVAYYPSSGLYLQPLADQIHSGAVIHAQDAATPSAKTDLLDFTPASTANHDDPALAVGQCWQDPYTDVRLCATSIANGMLTVTVDYSLPPCTNSNPTVAFNSADLAKSVAAGSGAQFRVNVTNNDSTSCSSRTFTMGATLPSGSGWATSFSSNPTLAPGATATVTMTKTPASSIAAGTYDINATASANTNSGVTSLNAALTVIEPAPAPPAAPSSVTVSVNQTGSGKNKIFQNYTVRWVDNSPNETGFALRRCRMSGKGGSATCTYDTWSGSVGANVVSLVDTTKPASGTWRFEVRSVNGSGDSNWVSSGNVSIP
jgi:hypothetical protein